MAIDYDDFLSSLAYDSLVSLSATSVALFLSGLSLLDNYYSWKRNGEGLDTNEWDFLEDAIAKASDEIMTNKVGFIVPSITVQNSPNLLACDGSTHNKADYPILYSMLHPSLIVSPEQFKTPDLRNLFLVGAGGNYAVADTGGSDSISLTVDEIPEHTHGFTQYTFGVDIESVGVPDPTGVGNPRLPENTDSTGGGQAHENRPPFYAILYYMIAR